MKKIILAIIILFSVTQIVKAESLDSWLDKRLRELAYCESGNDASITNWNDKGSPSFGLYQFKKQTWIYNWRRFGMHNDKTDEQLMGLIYSRMEQTNLAKMMFWEDRDRAWRHWRNCSIQIGLIKKEIVLIKND